MPGLSHWQSPRFFSYFPCNTSVPSMLADLLVSGFGVLGFQWIASPACTELEEVRKRQRTGTSSLPASVQCTHKGQTPRVAARQPSGLFPHLSVSLMLSRPVSNTAVLCAVLWCLLLLHAVQISLDWLAKLLGLPACLHSTAPASGSVLQGSASEATLVVLLAAKARTLDGRAPEDMLKLVVYGTGKGQPDC